MATPRRRSARLSRQSSPPDRSASRKTASTHPPLGSLLERDETPERGAQRTIDQILSTPNGPPPTSLREKITQLSAIKTPRTLPRVAHIDMDPKDAHQTTASPADSGFRLGFADISTKDRRSIARIQNSPTVARPPHSLSENPILPSFEFKFAAESNLSNEAQKLMENVRDEAARIKAQMLADKNEQDRKDDQAKRLLGVMSATGRKIAKPRGKAGRFSDIHMAEFKKMDSIANHASSFRAQPGFARPTTQSLKRSGSKAGLDEPERPRTAGKGTPGKLAPHFLLQASASPFKSTLAMKNASSRVENPNSAKRMRQSEPHNTSSRRSPSSIMAPDLSKPSGLPRVKSTPAPGIFSPTKSSLAHLASTKVPTPSPEKKSSLPRSNSVRSLKGVFEAVRAESVQALSSPTPHAGAPAPASTPAKADGTKSMQPLPLVPTTAEIPAKTHDILTDWSSMKNLPTATPKTGGLASKLPTFTGLKSILRSSRAPTTKTTSSLTLGKAGGTPRRADIAIGSSGSTKKVDFTPSTKSRYAVKLAAATPSPSKASHAGVGSTPIALCESHSSAAYTIGDYEEDNDEDWEDAEREVAYPILPSSSSVTRTASGSGISSFSAKAKQHSRRESKEFKSIFTTLEHPSRSKPAATLTNVNTKVNQTNPTNHANIIARSPSNTSLANPSPSTIRRVRTSGVAELVQPFEDTIKTVPHGLPGKKRRRESDKTSDLRGADEDAKENRRLSVVPQVPGGWAEDDKAAQFHSEADEGQKRGGKKAKIAHHEVQMEEMEVKKPKPNAAREAAAKNAKERKDKAKGVLSLSRLNMLARPKQRK